MANPVSERPFIPSPPGPSTASLIAWATAMVMVLTTIFTERGQRLNVLLPKDGTEAMTAPLGLATFTVATLPTASDWPGSVIYVSDGAGGAKFRGSDGTSWVNLG